MFASIHGFLSKRFWDGLAEVGTDAVVQVHPLDGPSQRSGPAERGRSGLLASGAADVERGLEIARFLRSQAALFRREIRKLY